MATPFRASAPASESADHVARAPARATRGARVRRRVGLPLLLLLVAATIEAFAWTIALPPLEGPDEIGHFAYTQRIVETGSIPWHPSGTPADAGLPTSTEAGAAARDADVFVQSGNIAARPPGAKVALRIGRRPARRTFWCGGATRGRGGGGGGPPGASGAAPGRACRTAAAATAASRRRWPPRRSTTCTRRSPMR